MMGRGRLKRLYNDYDQMTAMHQRQGLIFLVDSEGDPPERYEVGFRCRGVVRIDGNDQPILADVHQVDLILTADYPRMRPVMRWVTPIFHPNFDGKGNVCIQDWYPQRTLAELCEILAELVQYKNYNTTSPLNLDAAMWAMRHRDDLPVDKRNLFSRLSPDPTASSGPSQSQPTRSRFCLRCGRQFELDSSRFCPKCGTERRILPAHEVQP